MLTIYVYECISPQLMIMPFDCSEFADSPYSNVYIFWTKLV